jgi:hypothetical protein
MRILFFTLYFLFVSNHERKNLKEVFVYKYLTTTGYSNASALYELNKLQENKTESFKITQIEKDSLVVILNNSKIKKMRPTKLGMNVLFCKINDQNNITSQIIINTAIIRNFTDKKDYWIKNEEDRKWLHNFILKQQEIIKTNTLHQ